MRPNIVPALYCALASLAAFAAPAYCDVTMEERLSVEGAGLMSFANMNGHSVNTIANDRARMETDVQMQSKLIRAFARGMGPTAEIVRLDQDKIYRLDLKKKEYTEITFAQRSAQMKQAMEQQQKAQQSQQQNASGVDESQCEWSDPKADIKRTGEKSTIAGFDAERQIISATQSCKDKKTGQICDFGLTLDQWIAPKFSNAAEVTAYYRAYAQKMGIAATGSKDFSERAEQMFGRYKDIWKKIAAQAADMKGYPVKSSISFGIGGPQCQTTQAKSSDSESGSGPGGLAGQLGGALGGLFGKKKSAADAPAPATPPAPMPNGLIPMLTVATELVSVSSNSAGAQAFEVPAEFKKVNKE